MDQLPSLRNQWKNAVESGQGSAWTPPYYLFDPAIGGSWYMRHRPDAYEGKVCPEATEAAEARANRTAIRQEKIGAVASADLQDVALPPPTKWYTPEREEESV